MLCTFAATNNTLVKILKNIMISVISFTEEALVYITGKVAQLKVEIYIKITSCVLNIKRYY